jgi:MoaA/NifB/PqqE/SkfB family radical SAM enzyme
MQVDAKKYIFGESVPYWRIPKDLNDNLAYGLWNCLLVYDSFGNICATLPAHDGDFFPDRPDDYIKLLRKSIVTGQKSKHTLWPIRVDIDITQRCTSNCYFCYSKLYSLKPSYQNAKISLTDFEKILNDLSKNGTKSIRFTGGGDPLTHPDIKKMLTLPRQYGLRSCIITNGDLLNEEINKILIANTDHIRISINAGTDSTRYSLHHSRANRSKLSDILIQIKNLVDLRTDVWPSQKKPLIWTTFLLLPENISEIYYAAKLMEECGVDSISFRPIYHSINLPFSKKEVDTINNQFRKAMQFHCPPCFQVFIPKREFNEAGQLNPINYFNTCLSCGMRTVIEATAEAPMVSICGLYRGEIDQNLGLIKKGISFSEIWTGEKTEQILSNKPASCRNCIDISMNITLHSIKDILIKNPDAVFCKGWIKSLNRG